MPEGEPHAEALFARAAAALDAGDLSGAEEAFRSLVTAHPELHAAWNALSVVAVRAGMPEVAAAHARQALALERRNPVYMNNLGVALGEMGEFAEAEAQFRRALKLKPVYPEGLFNLGKVLHKQGRLDDASRAYERAYAMDREFPGLRLALAAMLSLRGQPERALERMREFHALDDRQAAYYADMLAQVEGPEAAIDWMRSTLASNPDWMRLRYALSLALLSAGRWHEGWLAYAARPSVVPEARRGHATQLPARMDGERVLLRGEQGLGDILFFLRFAPTLRERGAELTLECPPKLAGVVQANPTLAGVVSAPPDLDTFDHALWLGDLPLLLGARQPAAAFALRCEPSCKASAQQRLAGLGPPPYLGLTWRAGTDTLRQREHGNVRDVLSKEVDRGSLARAMRGWRGTVLALQRNPAAGEVESLSRDLGAMVHDLSALNEELPAMLGVLDCLDEYVTVSNTNVHLIAGLGKSARVLVPYPAEWRWMREGDASPWFPGFPLYRQSASREWGAALARLTAELRPD